MEAVIFTTQCHSCKHYPVGRTTLVTGVDVGGGWKRLKGRERQRFLCGEPPLLSGLLLLLLFCLELTENKLIERRPCQFCFQFKYKI